MELNSKYTPLFESVNELTNFKCSTANVKKIVRSLNILIRTVLSYIILIA